MSLVNSQNIRSSLFDHQRPHTTQKRVHKTPTQPSQLYNKFSYESSSSSLLIQNLKRAFPKKIQQQSFFVNFDRRNGKQNVGNIGSNMSPSINGKNDYVNDKNYSNGNNCNNGGRKQANMMKQITKNIKNVQNSPNSNNNNSNNTSHRIAYRRGINAQRNFYHILTQKLHQLQKSILSISKLNTVQIFEYRQKYVNQYLSIFFKQISEQCYEKSMFVAQLLQAIKDIFQELIKRLIKQLNKNQKMLLKQCQNTHQKYQKRFEQFQQQLNQKSSQIQKFKQIISKISEKNKKKCRKNKQMSHGIVQIVGRLSTIQKQRNQLKCQYINMLTLGFQGGMKYNQAKKYTISRFGIDNQNVNENGTDEDSFSSVTYLQSDQRDFEGKKIHTNKKNKEKQDNKKLSLLIPNVQRKQKKQKSAVFFQQKYKQQKQVIDKKVHKIKQKYVYGSNRLVIPQDQLISQNQYYDYIYSKNGTNHKRGYSIPQKLTNFSHQNDQIQFKNESLSSTEQKQSNQSPKFLQNKRIQTIPQHELSLIQKKCASTNFSIIQKYRDSLLFNKQIQTQYVKFLKINNFAVANNCTQYSQLDFQMFYNTEQQKSQQNQIVTKNDAMRKMQKSQSLQIISKQIEINSTLYKNFIIQDKEGEQKSQKTQQDTQKQVKLQKKSIVMIKKKPNQKKINSQLNKKKTTRPSIFKRASMISFNTNQISQNSQQRLKNIKPINPFIFASSKQQKIKRKQFFTMQNQSSQKIENNLKILQSNLTQSQVLQSQKSLQQISDPQQDYERTDMLSVIQNMSKLTPKGIYIDEAMIFLLKKSLFRIKHDKCDNVYKKNYQLITKIRQSMQNMKNVKAQALITQKNVIKMLSNVYDTAFSIISKQQFPHLQKKSKKNRNSQSSSSQLQTKNSSFLPSPSSNINPGQINLLQLLKQSIQKQYPMYKYQQIQHKMILLARSMDNQLCPNYMVKNFMLLSCLDDNIFARVIFSVDIQFYFYLLLQLNVSTSQQKKPTTKNTRLSNIMKIDSNNNYISHINQENDNLEQKQIKNYKISNSCGSYQNCYTNIQRLKQILPRFIKKFYKKQALLIFIKKRIIDTLEKISPSYSILLQNWFTQQYQQTQYKQNNKKAKTNTYNNSYSNHPLLLSRLDLYKCTNLIMQSIFSYKLDILKSYAQITQIQDITIDGCINQQLFIDIIGFIPMTKLQKLNVINKFRYDFGKQYVREGVNLINMVNFCINHDLQDFDQILYQVICRYPVTDEINKRIQKMEGKYGKFQRLEKICHYLHKKNVVEKIRLQSQSIIQQKRQYNQQQQSKQRQSLQPSQLSNKNTSNQQSYKSSNASHKNSNSNTALNSKNQLKLQKNNHKLVKHKQIWQIIGVSASNSLIHYKVTELQSSEMLEILIGVNLTTLYMATLCQLQEKKYKSGNNGNGGRNSRPGQGSNRNSCSVQI